MKPDSENSPGLPLPVRRCLTKEQAAEYLGIGVTLLLQAGPPPIKIGRRLIWDVIDLNAWLDEYKGRGRAGKEGANQWPVKTDSTGGTTLATGGLNLYYQTASEYAKALGLKAEKKRRPSSAS